MADVNKLTFTVRALGCKANQYEQDVIAAQLRELGMTQVENDADVFVLNTCTVTAEAGRKSRQILRRLKKENPQAIAIAMGCESEVNDLSAWADICIGTTKRNSIAQKLVLLLAERGLASNISAEARLFAYRLSEPEQAGSRTNIYEEPGVVVVPSDTRAQLKICDGCNNRCTYCAICLARGPVRSRDLDSIVEEANNFARQGFREIVLTGIEICSYGDDLTEAGIDLSTVLTELNKISGLSRIRLASLDPARVSQKFIDKISQLEKLCAHFHLSLQSGSNMVLRRMGRKYDTERFRKIVKALRGIWPTVGLTTDVICGFPGETDEEHQKSYQFCHEMSFSKIHVFPYSRRPGTAAASFGGQVPRSLIRQRSLEMSALSQQLAAEYCQSRIGDTAGVLLERELSPGIGEGYTETYMPCIFKLPLSAEKTARIGDIFRVKLESCQDGVAYGTGT
ncbi:MAG TPA: tRNA (N(6)-L-threonylcarbamoyladenosine(37)-C(2))-methylthiotransferase MtaB [Clostridiaceae bacterium]|nr:tRNA (N(6)-L-threonylcarbamoyladenosine(37)-C(2))-methylthiotransferase MtaB [Clostridiaceae bacterium]